VCGHQEGPKQETDLYTKMKTINLLMGILGVLLASVLFSSSIFWFTTLGGRVVSILLGLHILIRVYKNDYFELRKRK
jgi:hypothetical protein